MMKRENIINSKEADFDDELKVLLNEYNTLRDEIVSIQEYTMQNITTTYAGIGLLWALSPFIVEQHLEIILLIFPIFFLSIALTSVKYALAELNIGYYIKNHIAIHIRELFYQRNNEEDYEYLMSWENQPGVVRKFGLPFIPATGAHYWIVLLASIIPIFLYFWITQLSGEPYELSILQIYSKYILLGIDLIMFIYTIFVGIKAAFSR